MWKKLFEKQHCNRFEDFLENESLIKKTLSVLFLTCLYETKAANAERQNKVSAFQTSLCSAVTHTLTFTKKKHIFFYVPQKKKCLHFTIRFIS